MNLVDLALLLCPREFRSGYRREFRNAHSSEALNVAWTGVTLRSDSLARDAAFAVRSLAKSPLFTGIVLLTLSLAISVNATVFGAISSTLLQPLPFAQADRLAFLCLKTDSGPSCFNQLPSSVLGAYARESRTIARIGAWQSMDASLTGFGLPRSVHIGWLSQNAFDVLRVRPQLGRFFAARDALPGVHNLVISDGFWRTTLAGNLHAIGRILHLDGVAWRVVGIAPARFVLPMSRLSLDPSHGPEVFEPLPSSSFATGSPELNDWAFARLSPGATIAAVNADLARITMQLQRTNPQLKGLDVTAQPFGEVYHKATRRLLYLAFAIAMAVLLIACANVGNLLLARLASRKAEIGVRSSLGASRMRILQQLVIEMLIVSCVAAGLGIGLAIPQMQAIAIFEPGLLSAAHLHVDGRVVGLTFGVALLVTLVAGTLPAIASTQRSLYTTLKDAGRNADGGAAKILRAAFAAAQIALAFAVIVASGLLYHSFVALAAQKTGIDADNVVVANASLFAPRYERASVRTRFIDDVVARVQHLPGVTAAAIARPVPYTGMGGEGFIFMLPGRSYAPGSQPHATVTQITPQYFNTLHIPLILGREFTSNDTSARTRVAIVEPSLARQYFGDANPVGKHIFLPSNDPTVRGFIAATIVGEVADVNDMGLLNGPALYIPEAQWPTLITQIVVRTASPQPALGHEIAAAVAQADPLEALYGTYPLHTVLDSTWQQQRSSAALVGILAAVALLLALAGLYGVLSYAIEQRRHEIGVRMAIGAPARVVLRGVVSDALVLGTIGIAAGIVLAASGSHLIGDLLVGVSPFDPLTFGIVAVVLLACVVIASLAPALRAASIDPAKALRYE